MSKELIIYLIYIASIVFLTMQYKLKNILVGIIEVLLLLTLFYFNNLYYSYFIMELLFVLWISGIYGTNKPSIINIAIIMWVSASALWIINVLQLPFEYSIYFAIIAVFIKGITPFITSYESMASGFVRLSIPLFWLIQGYLKNSQYLKNYILLSMCLLFLFLLCCLYITRKNSTSYISCAALVYFCLSFFLLLSHGEKSFYDSFFVILLISAVLVFNAKRKVILIPLCCLIAVPPSPLYFIINHYIKFFTLNEIDMLSLVILIVISLRSAVDLYKVVNSK